ncbi:hypothetical protein DL766_008907 [Monosporascus sp. MC13-8B]|uniref:FAD dependent oxidoreductase domain-containing protein n=1 Tax=Monosporascus cannonballus TaxID=155416 RepID=A0ABY0GXI8_9PEZI|nr:hypothetical protein DL762_009106 [Monosporascus cannonballus]RYO88638.1 hypothetical protein DL763_005912 [Monosporascus cannonballus]RYP17383.1 hypothetical protein DL766_008907 [Monosporascus sp. MC13-8B]
MKLYVLSFSVALAAYMRAEEHIILDTNSNTDVTGDAQGINHGTTPLWCALDHLNTRCPEVGCCSKQELIVGTNFVKEGLLIEMELYTSAEALFNRQGKATRQTMVEIAKSISAQGHEFRNNSTPICAALHSALLFSEVSLLYVEEATKILPTDFGFSMNAAEIFELPLDLIPGEVSFCTVAAQVARTPGLIRIA